MIDVDVALIEDVIARRCPELIGRLDQLADGLSDDVRDLLRRAIVDEMCEQAPDDPQAGRRALVLEGLLLRLDRL